MYITYYTQAYTFEGWILCNFNFVTLKSKGSELFWCLLDD